MINELENYYKLDINNLLFDCENPYLIDKYNKIKMNYKFLYFFVNQSNKITLFPINKSIKEEKPSFDFIRIDENENICYLKNYNLYFKSSSLIKISQDEFVNGALDQEYFKLDDFFNITLLLVKEDEEYIAKEMLMLLTKKNL